MIEQCKCEFHVISTLSVAAVTDPWRYVTDRDSILLKASQGVSPQHCVRNRKNKSDVMATWKLCLVIVWL